ncbi:hypothetical protein F2Q69_00028470 [Brassica cretica]|uniref:Uncharacterized protein n=1 Tax=Brassica cretica TaxID=69181 RepID=A0A8S9S2M5_BRACR|nr:hypothetical protein F2Q69_00028470 [Brassica cretica]
MRHTDQPSPSPRGDHRRSSFPSIHRNTPETGRSERRTTETISDNIKPNNTGYSHRNSNQRAQSAAAESKSL